MESFLDYNPENFGGIKSFYFVPVNWVENIPVYTSHNLTGAVQLKSGKSWLTGLFIPQTLSFKEDPQDTAAGIAHRYNIQGIYPRQTREMSKLFSEMMPQKFILDLTDNNDQRRLVGIKTNGMNFKFSYFTDTARKNRPAYTFTFFAYLANMAPFYNPQ